MKKIFFSTLSVVVLLTILLFSSFSFFSNDYNLVIDEFYVFNDALTQDEIEELYRGELRVREVQVNNVELNISAQTATINVTNQFVSSSGGDVEYEIYYSPR